MSDTYLPSTPARSGGDELPARRRSSFAARRRALLVIVAAIVVGAAIYANYGPMQAYRDARSRLEQASTAVTQLEAQKTELQSQLGRLSEAGYLESLAREELGYTRPGEELYIVTGLEDDASPVAAEAPADAPADSPVDEPGLLERAISALMGIF